MSRRLRTPLVVGTTLFAIGGCGTSPTDPASRPCATMGGIEICADRSRYRPGDTITLTVANRGTGTVYKDSCSTEVVGKTSLAAEFEVDYDPTLSCGEEVTTAEILAAMVELAPGASIVESHALAPFAFQGFYRVNVWILDDTGARISSTPFHSGTFEVFPTAR